MENPQIAPQGELTPEIMFAYDNHKNIPWNMKQYAPPLKYEDPIQQIQQRAYSQQQKGQKSNRYVTKKGFYMDQHLKYFKQLPQPSRYNLKDHWKQTQKQKQYSSNQKMDSKLIKYTYLERIQMQQKNRIKPPVGAYNLNKTQDQIKSQKEKLKNQKRHYGPKRYFYEQTEALSNHVQSFAAHHPHLQVPHLKLDQTNYKFWLKKHKSETQRYKKKSLSGLDPGTYTPISLQFESFDKIRAISQRKKKRKSVNTGFGTDTKFTYDRPKKQKIIQVRPEPGTYNMMIQWKGKGAELKKNNWIANRSTGFSQGIYH